MSASDVLDIGSRLELFVDDYLIGALAGRAVRFRFVMKDADLYSIRFR